MVAIIVVGGHENAAAGTRPRKFMIGFEKTGSAADRCRVDLPLSPD
jgi:hypothetical protein